VDYFDELKPERPVKKLKNSNWLLNLVSLVLLLGTGLTLSLLIKIYQNPYNSQNPFPPPVIPLPYLEPSKTPIPILTWTAVPSELPLVSPTPAVLFTSTTIPTVTVTPTSANTPFMVFLPTYTASPIGPTPDTESPYPFVILPGSPAMLDSSIMLPDIGCNWMGVAGNIVDMQGAPIIGLRVQLYGSLHGRVKAEMSISGTAQRYGDSGYEIMIDKQPSNSTHTLWVQVFNQAGGELSDKIFFDTRESCEENMIIINFKQIR